MIDKEIKIGNDTPIQDREPEIWKDIRGYEGFYQISSWGMVKSLDRTIKLFKLGKPKLKRLKGKFLKLQTDEDGYSVIDLSKNGNNKMFKAHRLVADAFLPPSEDKNQVHHKHDNKTNNYFKDLERVTNQENMDYAIKSGVINTRGENSPGAKLTDSKVLEIRNLYQSIPNQWSNAKELAKMFNISKLYVKNIVSKKVWKHI